MLYVVLAQALLIALLIALVHSLERSNRLEREDRARAHDRMLQSMADRIQHPERPVTPDGQPIEIPEPEPDDSALIGHIAFDEQYGQSDFHDMTMYEGGPD